MKAMDPIYAIVDEDAHDNYGLVLVPDCYSAWPQAKLLPGTETYVELLEGLEKAAMRYCRNRGEPRYCKRIFYNAIPSRAECGAWHFTASYGDIFVYTYATVLNKLNELKRIDEIYFLVDEHEPRITLLAFHAVSAAAYRVNKPFTLLLADPKPYPYNPRAILEIAEHKVKEHLYIHPIQARVKIIVNPHTPREVISEIKELEKKIKKKVEKSKPITNEIDVIIRLYRNHTRLIKKNIGGKTVHPFTVQLEDAMTMIYADIKAARK